jgi:hypothetical protein
MAIEINNVDLLYSFFEYQASYREPIFSSLLKTDSITTLYRAFSEWNLNLNNVTFNPNPTNASEFRTTIELLNRKYVFTTTLGGASLSVTNPSWEEAEQIIKIMRAGVEAVKDSTGAEIIEQAIQLSMHLKSKEKSVKDLTSGLLATDLMSAFPQEAHACGFSIYAGDSTWIVDLSALEKEALFVRLYRTFGSAVSFEEIALAVNKDQEKILETLRLKITEDEN